MRSLACALVALAACRPAGYPVRTEPFLLMWIDTPEARLQLPRGWDVTVAAGRVRATWADSVIEAVATAVPPGVEGAELAAVQAIADAVVPGPRVAMYDLHFEGGPFYGAGMRAGIPIRFAACAKVIAGGVLVTVYLREPLDAREPADAPLGFLCTIAASASRLTTERSEGGSLRESAEASVHSRGDHDRAGSPAGSSRSSRKNAARSWRPDSPAFL